MSLHLADVSSEYEKNKHLKKEEVKKFNDWVNQQPHLPKINGKSKQFISSTLFLSNF